MKKFIVANTGEEVKLGEEINLKFKVNTQFGIVDARKTIILTEEILSKLLEDKSVKEVDSNSEIKELWNKIFFNFAEKTGWKIDKLEGILKTICSINEWAVIQIFLKEMAIELDKKYDDHISKSEAIFVISPQDFAIHEVSKNAIDTYKYFPAFRNMHDVMLAYNVLKTYMMTK